MNQFPWLSTLSSYTEFSHQVNKFEEELKTQQNISGYNQLIMKKNKVNNNKNK